MEPNDLEARQDLRSYLQLLRRRWVTIAVTVVVALGLTLAYSLTAKPSYTASAQVLVPSQPIVSTPSPIAGQGQSSNPDSQQNLLADAQQFAEGDATAKVAATRLGFKPVVAVSASATADILTFSASNGSSAEAAKIANVDAQSFITALRHNQVSQYAQDVSALESSIAKAQAAGAALPPGSTQRLADKQSVEALTQSLQDLQAQSQLVDQSGPSVVDAAVPPASPSSPKPLRDGLLAGVIGLVLGIGFAFVKEHLDDKVGSFRDVEHYSGGLPVLGTIPTVDAWRDQRKVHLALVEDQASPVSEAYRTFRTAVQFLGIEQPHRVLAVTSSLPGEGKTTTVANLAVSFARAGWQVVVVSCDLRRPRLHEFFGLDNATGMTSVLLGEVTLRDALQRVKGEDNLRVLASGPVPPNPAEILALDRVRKLVDALAAHADVVLLDCPPVLPVSDTLLVSRLVDGMLLLAVAGKTKTHDLQRSCELLRQVNAPLLGTAVNRVPQTGAYASGYRYGYGYGYAPSPADGNGSSRSGAGAAGTSRRDLLSRLGSTARYQGAGSGPDGDDGLDLSEGVTDPGLGNGDYGLHRRLGLDPPTDDEPRGAGRWTT